MVLLWVICYKLSFNVRAINHTNKIIDNNMGYSLTSLFGGNYIHSMLQVNKFQKVYFVKHFVKEFEQKFYISQWYSVDCRIMCQIFKKIKL